MPYRLLFMKRGAKVTIRVPTRCRVDAWELKNLKGIQGQPPIRVNRQGY